MFTKHAGLVGLVALSAYAYDPICIQLNGRVSEYDHAFSATADDGRIFALCYNGQGQKVDDTWVTDIEAMLNTISNDACCVDCVSSAGKNGCTGESGITNMDGCQSTGLDTLDDVAKANFLSIIQDAVDQGIEMDPLDEYATMSPSLTIDGADDIRVLELVLPGNGDTC